MRGGRVALKEVIQLLQEIVGVPVHLMFEEKQHGDVRDTFADTSLARQVIEYAPVFPMREGLRYELEYVESLY